MNTGGAETFLMKIYRNIDKSLYQMDFCVNSTKNYYDKEIQAMGGKLYVIEQKSKNPVKSFLSLKDIVRDNEYDYVIRVNEHSLSTIDLIAAKCGGAHNLIMRSSNASSGTKLTVLLHKVFLPLSKIIPTVKLAPSTLAGEYTFGNRSVKNGKVVLLPNGLEINRYKYDFQNRHRIRNSLGIKDEIVIGHVGRFSAQKNHSFIISVFEEFIKSYPNSKLILIGDGEYKRIIEKRIEDCALKSKVIMVGICSNVEDYLSAMDLFLFPSLYEGMPNTVIEAQTCGLPCLISDTITPEVQITDIVEMDDINKEPGCWAKHLKEMWIRNNNIDRLSFAEIVRNKGYDITEVVQLFTKTVFGE